MFNRVAVSVHALSRGLLHSQSSTNNIHFVDVYWHTRGKYDESLSVMLERYCDVVVQGEARTYSEGVDALGALVRSSFGEFYQFLNYQCFNILASFVQTPCKVCVGIFQHFDRADNDQIT